MRGEPSSNLSSANRADHAKGLAEPHASRSPRLWKADLALAVTAFFWGVNVPVMVLGVHAVDPFTFNALRLLLSTIVLGICAYFETTSSTKSHSEHGTDEKGNGGKSKSEFKYPSIARILLFCFLSGFLYQFTFLLGVSRTSAGNTALLLSSMPMWASLLAFLFLNERLSGRGWIGLAFALFGTLLITIQKSEFSNSIVGNLLVLAAAWLWATSTVASRPLLNSIPPIRLAFWACATTLPIHLAIAWKPLWEDLGKFSDLKLLTALLYSGICSTGLAYALWNYGVKQIGASHAAIFQNLVPFIALLASWILLGDSATTWQLLGGLLILVGLFTMRSSRKK